MLLLVIYVLKVHITVVVIFVVLSLSVVHLCNTVFNANEVIDEPSPDPQSLNSILSLQGCHLFPLDIDSVLNFEAAAKKSAKDTSRKASSDLERAFLLIQLSRLILLPDAFEIFITHNDFNAQLLFVLRFLIFGR